MFFENYFVVKNSCTTTVISTFQPPGAVVPYLKYCCNTGNGSYKYEVILWTFMFVKHSVERIITSFATSSLSSELLDICTVPRGICTQMLSYLVRSCHRITALPSDCYLLPSFVLSFIFPSVPVINFILFQSTLTFLVTRWFNYIFIIYKNLFRTHY